MQDVKLPSGRSVVAVSGGVDSMVLLDVLRRQPGLVLLVVHVNHGLRVDADQDEELVAHYATSHNISYTVGRLQLAGRSEAEARYARYKFLRQCSKEFKATAIVLAHHQDDLIETALLNQLRGTGWRGLAPFARDSDLLRPLVNTPKHQLIAYARKHFVPWREDSTNADETYTRNYIRRTLAPYLDQKSEKWIVEFMQHIRKQQALRRTIESTLQDIVQKALTTSESPVMINRHLFIVAPHNIARELLYEYIRHVTSGSTSRPTLERALLFIKVARPGKRFELNTAWQLRATTRQIIVEERPPMIS